jgi:hypothetical protein
VNYGDIMMTKQKAQALKSAWFNTIDPGHDIQLFKTESDGVTLVKTEQGWIQRSVSLTRQIEGLRTDSKLQSQGICYLIYSRGNDRQVEPLYVGIAERAGKKRAVSSLFDAKSGWMRFGHEPTSNGHLGNLNKTLLGLDKKERYAHWVDALTVKAEHGNGVLLLKKVFVHIEAWTPEKVSIVPELGHTPLYVEEKLRLWVLGSAEDGKKLLNREGNRRCQESHGD